MRAQIHDFRGISDLDAEINGILLIAGSNGAGKSSACTAIAACLTGDLLPFAGVTKAKAALLVRDGGASASATLTGPDGGASVVWPACERAEKGRAPWASPVAAGLVNPLAMDAKTRAAWLIGLIGAMPTKEACGEPFQQAGLTVVEANQLWTAIEARGWDAAHTEAKEQGAKWKGQWEKVTGARYGSAKAAAWRPEGWRSGIDALGIDELMSNAENAIAQIEDVRKVRLQGEVKRRDAESAISAAHRAKSEITHAGREMRAAKNAVDKARAERAKFGPPAEYVWNCPCCEARVALIEGDLVEAPSDATEPHIVATAARAIVTAEQAHQRAEAHHKRLSAEIESGEKAEAVIAALPPLPDAADLARIKAAADEAGAMLRMKRQVIEANELHEKITRQIAIVGLLAEDGLRQQALVAALSDFATELCAITSAAGWRAVYVDADMSLSYGGRPVSLCSGGEQYRVRCVLQIAATRRDGSSLVILDGADILDRDGRNGLFRVLRGIQAVIGMTMRREDMPDLAKAAMGASVWISEPAERRVAA